jgi:hypothetical protein
MYRAPLFLFPSLSFVDSLSLVPVFSFFLCFLCISFFLKCHEHCVSGCKPQTWKGDASAGAAVYSPGHTHQHNPGFVSIPAQGFYEACENGGLIEAPVTGVKMILRDGVAHSVDSNEMAFRLASRGAFRQGVRWRTANMPGKEKKNGPVNACMCPDQCECLVVTFVYNVIMKPMEGCGFAEWLYIATVM